MNFNQFPSHEQESFSSNVENRFSRFFAGVDTTTSSSIYGFLEKPGVPLSHGPELILLRRNTTKQVVSRRDNRDSSLAGTTLDVWDEVKIEHILTDTLVSAEDDSIVDIKPERYILKFTDYSRKSGKEIVCASFSYEFIPSQNPSEVLLIPSKGPAYNPETQGHDNSKFFKALERTEDLFSTVS